ncbi:CUB and sushi domain-containing protein 3-like [Dreissena polymorpha]|uniref:CUB and sushi domain-containing protein 3-like n=1 Tax=Dreissena polymorpha TaxID=45954 RepID=UPI002263E4A9|nr:CUB and sushi domain-containing protein 3-like [Dreissena polymorpha]
MKDTNHRAWLSGVSERMVRAAAIGVLYYIADADIDGYIDAADYAATDVVDDDNGPGADIVYVGCYEDHENRVLLPHRPNSNSNTPVECASRCSDYRYAGVEYRLWCFCGNSLNATKTQESHCNSDCPGDRSKKCGGYWRISVYTNWACGPPPAIANGNATLRQGINVTYGSIADVHCDPGFISQSPITCMSNKSWEYATCKELACGPPPAIANGNATLRQGTNITYGSIADVDCDHGFIGHSTITCLSNKSWEYATCDQLDCGSTLPIVNGRISLLQRDNTSYGTQATVSCSVGFRPNISRITCLANGKWESATCKQVNIVYLGCYEDNQIRVLLPMMPASLSNTPEECASQCSDYRYAGVEVGFVFFTPVLETATRYVVEFIS